MIFKEQIECALPARMMFAIACSEVFVFVDGHEDQGRAELDKMRGLLKVACIEPLRGMKKNVAMVIGKQIDRLHFQVMERYDEHRADKVATAIYYFLKDLTDTGYLELWEGSSLAEAAALYLPMIEHVFGETKLDESAQKQSRRIMKDLQEKGYYV